MGIVTMSGQFGSFDHRRLAAILLTLLSSPAHAQFTRIGGGPSGAQVAGVIAGAAGATGLILYFTLHKPQIVGCVSAEGGTSLTDEKDKRTYALVGDGINFKAGERVKLKGKKLKAKDGKLIFRVSKIAHDYGGCTP